MFYKNERTALFIDGNSIHHTAKSLGFTIDYALLLRQFNTRCAVVAAHYFNASPEIREVDDYCPRRKLFDFLGHNGFTTHIERKTDGTDHHNAVQIRLAVTAMKTAMQARIDHAVIFTHDPDQKALLVALSEMGVRVTLVSKSEGEGRIAPASLRRKAQTFVELATLQSSITLDTEDAPSRHAA